MSDNYRTYFDLDDAYFPQINETTIENAKWEDTYPHETFVKLLQNISNMLDGKTKRSVWIHGSYGTGKSRCAFALKKILEVSEGELKAYWSQPERQTWPLNKKSDLLTKLCGHKSRKIVTAYRYGSGGITSTGQLLLAVQESVKKALLDQDVPYTGDDTLKEAVISWIEKDSQKLFFNSLLESDKYNNWPQANADEVLDALRKSGNVSQLMNNIFDLAVEEGITALNLTTEGLIKWLKDVIEKNDIKIVLVWDEFSDYFKGNRNSLDQFQKLAELCESNFYFVIVTHETSGLITANDKTWDVVKQRFDFSEIELPDSIAFELISHARKVKKHAEPTWNLLADTINSWLPGSRAAVMKETKVTSEEVIKGLLPLHPMGALALKYIAVAFQSNQRSIFNFMSQEIEGVETFQWFVANTNPDDDYPILSIDRLWNYFYDHHKNELTVDVRSIMDTFVRQKDLNEKQASVLKTILTMQAINHRLGDAIELFLVTKKNLNLAFEGNRFLEGSAASNVADGLVTNGVLYRRSLGDGVEVYAAQETITNVSKIMALKEEVREKINTANLVLEGCLSDVLELSSPLRLRYELSSDPDKGKLTAVTLADFTNQMNKLAQKASGWKFHAVIAFAKDDKEHAAFRKVIEEAAKNPVYKDIVIIDTLSTYIESENLETYIEFSANAMYYNHNDPQLAKQNADKAKSVLATWKENIKTGSFVVYSSMNPDGERLTSLQGVHSLMETVVKAKYPDIFDFNKGLSGTTLRPTHIGLSAKCGAMEQSSGVVKDVEKSTLQSVWKLENYWEKQPSLPISKIKIALDKRINDAFNLEGQISISEIYSVLEKNYGFSKCNLSAFLAGFLLKEYACEPYNCFDSANGTETMSPKKLGEMFVNFIGKAKPVETYIVKMNEDEMAFYSLTESICDIPSNSLGGVAQADTAVKTKMGRLSLPIWCLAEVDDAGVYDIVEKYIEFVQSEGKEAHQKIREIGKAAKNKPTLTENLKTLITKEKCQEGMRAFLSHFEGGKIAELSREIDAETLLLSDIEKLFAVDNSCRWNRDNGEREIRRLLTDYGFVRDSNIILASQANSLSKCKTEWREKLKFVSISAEQLNVKLPNLAKLFEFLHKIASQSDITSDQLKSFHAELTENSTALVEFLRNEKQIFAEIYAPYLEGLNDEDIDTVKADCQTGMFILTPQECNSKVKTKAEEYRQGQLKTKLFELWQDKTDTRNPREWSNRYNIPILCMVSTSEYDSAQKTFGTLNRNNPTKAEIGDALTFLESAKFLSDLNDEPKRKTAFVKGVIGKYAKILPNTAKVQNELGRLSIEPYDWFRHPAVNNRIVELAQAEYNAGGSNIVLKKIDEMNDSVAKKYLKQLIEQNMNVGLEIIEGGNDE